MSPEHLAELIALVDGKRINSKIAKELLNRMWAGEGSPAAIVEREGLAQTSDPAAIERFVDEVIAANPSVVADYKAGKTNVAGFLVGQVMKASRGKADPALVNELVKKKLSVVGASPMPLADRRTLDALDFAGVRERVVAAHAHRSVAGRWRASWRRWPISTPCVSSSRAPRRCSR